MRSDRAATLDLVAIDRVVTGRRRGGDLTPVEKRHAAALMREKGLTYRAIGTRLRVHKDTIIAWLRPAGGYPARPLTPCPSRAAYHRHLAAGEDCPPCRHANAIADARYRRTGTTTAA